jgi:hypothetical protein
LVFELNVHVQFPPPDLEQMRYVLATGWGVEDERLALLLAVIDHALDFQTWRSLVRQQNLNDEQAVEVMTGMVRCLAHD